MNVKLKEDIKPISYIKTNAAEMLDYINENKNPIIITQHGQARGVFIDVESYQQMTDALALMGLIQVAEESIATGGTRAHALVFDGVRKRLAQDD
jgi:PHD/YefM family antitoxin component YafN of YafNO toxin-antitoxin module